MVCQLVPSEQNSDLTDGNDWITVSLSASRDKQKCLLLGHKASNCRQAYLAYFTGRLRWGLTLRTPIQASLELISAKKT